MNTLPFLGTGYTGAPVQLTLQAGGAAPVINFGRLFRVEAYNGGSRVWYRTTSESIGSYNVTETPAAIATTLPLILLTQVITSGADTISYPAYYPIGLLSEPETLDSVTTINVFHSSNAVPETITVSETKAAIIAAWVAAAAIAGGGGSSTAASYTAAGADQAGATATTTGEIRITGGAANTGVRLDAATAGEQRKIYNATTTMKFVYPSTGEFIDPAGVNIGITLGPSEGIFLSSNLNGHWSRYENEFHQFLAASGTIQGGGQILVGVQDVTVTTATGGVNTAITLAAALPGQRVTVANNTSVVLRLYPALGDAITTNAVDAFLNVGATKTVELICDVAGLWIFAQSQVDVMAITTINTLTPSGSTTLGDPTSGANATFSFQGIDFYRGLAVSYATGTAGAGGGQAGGESIITNVFNATTVATAGDSLVLTGIANMVIVTNSTVTPLALYCASGGTMNGVADGFITIAGGQTYMVEGIGDGTTPYAFTSTLVYSGPGEYTAVAGTPPALVHPYLTIVTVAAPLDEVILDQQQQSVVIVNSGANTALLLPPAGDTLNGGANLQIPIRAIVHVQKTANGAWTATFQAFGVQSGTAFAGGGQASGTKILGPAVNVTTVAVANDSFTIALESPKFFYFSNNGANACDVFPPSSGTINGGAADAAISVAAAAEYIFFSNDMFTWLAVLQ